ncbi:MAG: hypothetical protein JXN61_15005 [Sedimentisphaerales bacterium]|nr:hypothetical protein [Sedimentisphaerales bacterium]
MIRLNCDNCGQMMQARREYAGKKCKCPNCKSIVRVPTPAAAGPPGNQRAAAGIGGDSSQKTLKPSLAKRLTDEGLEPAERRTIGISGLCRRIRTFLTPSYSEVSLFLMSVTTFFVFSFNPVVRQRFVDLVFSAPGIFLAGVYVIMYGCGLVLCVYHIFSSREKSSVEKYLMLFFAVLTNGISGICAGVYIFRHSILWLAVLPIWNIISGVVLILMLWFEAIDRECVNDQDATAGQAMIGFVMVLAVFLACSSLLRLHWSITFSICIAYSTSFERAIRRLFR